MGKPAEARQLFGRALELNRDYPNAYFGLAMLHHKEGRIEDAYRTLTELFTRPVSRDPRSQPVYNQARATYLHLNGELTVRKQVEMQAYLDERRRQIGKVTGFPIEIVEDNTLESVYAVSQMAWKHGHDRTVIRYRRRATELFPHIIAHELEHICLEHEARTDGRNRLFSTSATSRKHAIESIADHIVKLQKRGYADDAIQAVTLQMTEGLASQVFNCPLDMVIEQRVFEKCEIIRPSQFVSLAATHAEYSQAFTNEEIRRLSPPRIFRANSAMNCAYALFIDSLYGSATTYGDTYRGTDVFGTGQQLFEAWRTIKKRFQPGDEYRLVDDFARILKLEKWFEWKPDNGAASTGQPVGGQTPQGTTNPELLTKKHPVAVWYLLDALQRYDKLPVEKVREIAFEIAGLGRGGLDYADAEKKYRLTSLPGESFSGLQLMCFMFAGFKRIAPEHDLGMDLHEPFLTALQMFNAQKGQE
jgi:tetratricopeptide (TPR) repeat protein